MTRRPIGVLTAALVLLLTAPAAATPYPDRLELPAGFQPEGIAIGAGPTAWLGSLADGDIYAVDLRTGAGEVVSEGPGTPSVGLAVDSRGHLFVAGGPAGDARVVDTATGEVLATFALTGESTTFVNDVVLTREAAWFTDSFRAVLYRVPLGPAGALPDPGEVTELPLTGDWEQLAGFNANGIETTPDGKALLVVSSATGVLHRVDPATGETRAVDVEPLPAADGLLLQGRTLYAVQNAVGEIAVVELDPAGTRGTSVDTLTSPDLDVPTTVAAFGSDLYLPNARFGTPPAGAVYWVTAVDR
ncbi:SMP-30/gluconolactonase/LRE family protein [Georgenia muralis]|uniref:Sugar lactone lactonase YvrE n=1 Tax=Georgenia muralis TaxID=154117 RepID=A0A3N4ZTT7_9MICO|nr:superoxide dismutase [Georgenia muralis]RPF28858.1 sugar lactone lactonase YvrE [Georgenia muralis]